MKIKLSSSGEELDVLFGTDAEFFLQDSTGKIVPASRFIPGTKAKPHVLVNGVCHPDGLSLEVGCPPSDTPEGMLANLFKVLQEVTDLYLTPNGLSIASCFEVNVSDVDSPSESDLEFGCGTEYDRNSDRMYKHRDLIGSSSKRYSGFHVHIGYTSGQIDSYFSFKDASRLVAKLDSLVQEFRLGTSTARAKQYGGYGAFRIKPYGIEYRCMDCSVLTKQASFERLLGFLKDLPKAIGEL